MQNPLPSSGAFSRRTFLRQGGFGLGAVALSQLFGSGPLAASGGPLAGLGPQEGGIPPGVAGYPQFPPRIKRVIFLCMAGGPSHLETFDNKPKLVEMDGQPMPTSVTDGQPIAQLQKEEELKVLRPQYAFNRHGESGQEISDALPFTARMADKICILRGMKTEQINHDPAHSFMNTGTAISGRPSMGSWVTYGLGSECADLPGFVVLTSVGGRDPQPINSRQWHNGFLPSRFQGVPFQSQGDPIHYVNSPPGMNPKRQRETIDAIAALNEIRDREIRDPEVATRIAQYEMAFRMQTSIPDLADFSDEPQEVLDLYGTTGADGSFAANCLMARRLAERGVRFIHLYHRGWDHHGEIKKYMDVCCGLTDRPSWALVTDLERRGLLDDTLVVWGGEFGRTPMFQGKGENPGRDHHIRGFSMWLAGGGIRGGITHGATDDLGYHAVEGITHVHDLHATMLHLLGIDHTLLTVRVRGRDFRLTDVHGRVIDEILT
jgi:hypothetical protein